MSERQWKRLDAAERVEQRLLSNTEAAALLGLSTGQMRRLRRRVDELGAAGVIHGNAGRAPAHRVPAQIRARIVQLRLGKYAGFNDQHFTEKLAEHEGLGCGRRCDGCCARRGSPPPASGVRPGIGGGGVRRGPV